MASLGRVLVVDDDPDVSDLLRDALTDFGYTVQVAVAGPAGVEGVSTWQPDVVLLDLWLPGAPGEDVLKAIRQRDPALPVVIITGNRDPEVARTVLDVAFDFIPKPFELTVIERVVAAAVAERERRAGPR